MGESLPVGHLSANKKDSINYDVSTAAPQQPDIVLQQWTIKGANHGLPVPVLGLGL